MEYLRNSEKTNTHVFLYVDHYVGDGEQAHLLSLFGGDAEVGAVRAAIYEKHVFSLTFPDGRSQKIGFGPDAECYYGSLSLPAAKRSLRHLIALSAALHANGTAGQTFLTHLDAESKDLAWASWLLSWAVSWRIWSGSRLGVCVVNVCCGCCVNSRLTPAITFAEAGTCLRREASGYC
jgi:hypothetical protein